MARPIAIIGAPSSIGLRPYDDGVVRHVNRAPAVLRARGLSSRLRAVDLGDVSPPPYREFVPLNGAPRHEHEVLVYSRSLAGRVSRALENGHFALVLGGDCSIVLGCLLAAKKRTRKVGLAYLDAHADSATPEDAPGGSVSNMALSFAVGHGHSELAHLGGAMPLIDPRSTAMIGRRSAQLADPSILDIPASEFDDPIALPQIGGRVLDRVASGVGGFWIHVDADVLNPLAMRAVGSPVAGGPMPGELAAVLSPLVADPRAVGLSLSIYDPALDPDRSGARRLVDLLAASLVPGTSH